MLMGGHKMHSKRGYFTITPWGRQIAAWERQIAAWGKPVLQTF